MDSSTGLCCHSCTFLYSHTRTFRHAMMSVTFSLTVLMKTCLTFSFLLVFKNSGIYALFLCFSFPFFFFTPTLVSKNVNKCDHCILCSLLTIAFHGSPAVCVSICLLFNHIKWHCKWATWLRFTGRLAYLISLLTRRTEGQRMRHLLKEEEKERVEKTHTLR